ncbi:MAG TPA: hypothetical protein VN671_10195 [Solirubrobacterales bacterium]|nr:hypothetical protein [Solirubrobacterales bacterium]
MSLRTKAILWAAALAVVGMLYVFSREPSDHRPVDECPAKGIDPQEMNEGTCQDGGTKTVVVDKGHLLEMETLDARLDGMREATTMSGPEGTKPAKSGREFVTFDLAITNRTGDPQSVGESQLALGGGWGEDTAVERGYEPRSFLNRPTPIAPGETADGTVTFQLGKAGVEMLHKEGNLDIDNFGTGDGEYAPEEVFDQPELGVMRTYEHR